MLKMGRLLAFRTAETVPAGKDGEAALVERCRAGDRAAQEIVLSSYADMLELLIIRLIGRGADAEDVLHATFLAIIDAFPRFRGEARLTTWLSRIAIHTAVDALRHRQRRQTSASQVDPDQAVVAQPWEDERVHAQRELQRLHELLDELPPIRRVAFVLFVIEGRTLDEVAALTGASVMATKSRVFWARRSVMERAAKDPILRGRLGLS